MNAIQSDDFKNTLHFVCVQWDEEEMERDATTCTTLLLESPGASELDVSADVIEERVWKAASDVDLPTVVLGDWDPFEVISGMEEKLQCVFWQLCKQ